MMLGWQRLGAGGGLSKESEIRKGRARWEGEGSAKQNNGPD